MLHRDVGGGLLLVGQPAHAWAAGQLARAWAEPFAPREAVCLAAEQHDVGWTEWELAPELDPVTGRPYVFGALPEPRKLALWSGAAERLLPQSPYAALLVSLHGTLIVERFPPPPQHAALAEAFLAGERAFQKRLRAALRAGPDEVARNRELVFGWDALSLALVHGVTGERDVAGLTLAAEEGDPTRLRVAPWPFRDGAVTVAFEGRVLDETFADEETMRRALEDARWVAVETTLRPG